MTNETDGDAGSFDSAQDDNLGRMATRRERVQEVYWVQFFECHSIVFASSHMGASRLRRDCLRQRGMPGCGHP
jgi:hypothetical protein